MAASTKEIVRSNPGAFWVECANVAKGTCRSKTGKAQASLTPKGKPILCRKCQAEAKVRGTYLDQPTKAEKVAFIHGRAKPAAKKVTPRQAAKVQRKATAKAVSKPKTKRPAKKAA